MTQHADLTGADLHEPKGAAAASANTVYVADGAGSGTWQKVGLSQSSEVKGFVVAEHPDISEATSIYVPFSRAVTIDKVTTVIEDNITVANAILTVYNASSVSMGSITITQSGSAPGDVDTLASPVNNSVSADSYIRITSDGGSTTACRCQIVIEFTYTI